MTVCLKLFDFEYNLSPLTFLLVKTTIVMIAHCKLHLVKKTAKKTPIWDAYRADGYPSIWSIFLKPENNHLQGSLKFKSHNGWVHWSALHNPHFYGTLFFMTFHWNWPDQYIIMFKQKWKLFCISWDIVESKTKR